MTTDSDAQIPSELKPADGRFGCGPSKVRPEALARPRRAQTELMGTSHRQAPVRDLVGEVRGGLGRALLAARRLRGRARQRRHDRLLGGGRRLARARARAAPHLRRVLGQVREVDRRGAVPRRPDRGRGRARRRARADAPTPPPTSIAWAHNETSTGVMVDVQRPAGRRRLAGPDRRHLGRRRPAARRGAGRRLLLRPAEGLRLRRRPLAGAAQPGRDRARSRSSTAPTTAGSRPSSRCRRRSRTRARSRPTTRRRWRP